MRIWARVALALVVGGSIVSSGGCSNNTVDKEAKRESDRRLMRLSEAESQRDQYKAQMEKAQAELAEARKNTADGATENTLLRKQVSELQQTVTQLTTQNDKLKAEVARISAKLPAAPGAAGK